MKERIFEDETIEIWKLVVGQMQTNCYVLIEKSRAVAVVIDAGEDGQYIIDFLMERGVTPERVLATHGHFDHILSVFELTQTFGIPFAVHEEDRFLVEDMQHRAGHFLTREVYEPAPTINETIEEGITIPFGQLALKVIHTPGHTPGSVCFYITGKPLLFTGDTIFADGAVGRTDFSYSDADKLQESIKRLFVLPGTTRVFSGHGAETTIAQEEVFHSLS